MSIKCNDYKIFFLLLFNTIKKKQYLLATTARRSQRLAGFRTKFCAPLAVVSGDQRVKAFANFVQLKLYLELLLSFLRYV